MIKTTNNVGGVFPEKNVIKKPELPRRIQLNKCVPAERLIYNCMTEIELLGSDERLTSAIIFLEDAKKLVGDFIDEQISKTK